MSGRTGETRERIDQTLRRVSYPMTASMLAERLGKSLSTVTITCAVLALEGRIVRERICGAAWYGKKARVFRGRTYWLQRQRTANPGERGWVVFRVLRTERGARTEGRHWSRVFKCPVRLLHEGEVLQAWNVKEESKWLNGKRVLAEVRRVLRDQSNSQIAVFKQGLTLPR